MQTIANNGFGKLKAVFAATLLSLLLSMGILLAQAPEKSYADTPNNYTAEITVKGYGTITVELNRKAAPTTVDNFVRLAKSGFYDGLTFHRIYNGFMIQGGGYRTDGTHTDAASIKGEFASNGYNNPIAHTRGVISMARSNDPNSASSEFFIMHQANTSLDGYYAAFGKVTKGMDVVDKIAKAEVTPTIVGGQLENSDPVNPPVIESVKITEGVSSVGWKQSGGRWWYSYDSVTAKGLGKSFPTNEKIQIGGQWYYFDAQGWMRTGWVKDGSRWQYLSGSGLPATGWVKSGGAWYYMDPSDKYMVSNGEKTIGGSTYRFNASGAMLTGWFKTGSDWLFYHGSGAKATGWLKSGSYWYYLDPKNDGIMVANHKSEINGKTYFFNNDGVMGTGWISVSPDWYYANSSGAMMTGWLYSGGAWYYLDPKNEGAMTSESLKLIDNQRYSFNANGAMRTGWVSYKDGWRYFTGSGAMKTGWLKDGARWYYLDPDSGLMATDDWIGNDYVNADGVWTKSK